MLTRKKPMSPGTKGLKRSGFKTKADAKPMARSTKPMKAVGERGKRMRQGKVAANVEESAWMSAVVDAGCIVCRLQYGAATPAELHHLKEGDRRIGHLASIGLCVPHHRGGNGEGLFISRHPWLKRFESAYGTEQYLLEETQKLLAK